jgi:voltage-gated potassium channel
LSSMFVVFVMMIISSILMYTIEHEEQPKVFENAFTNFYSIETLTTVSYGDIYPITPFGRVLGALISLLGLSLVAVPTGYFKCRLYRRYE